MSRTITGTFYQNIGLPGAPGTSLDLAGRHISVGSLNHTVDSQLTKIVPGDVTFTVEDYDEAVWTYVQTTLQSATGLLPPFITLDVGGDRRFVGIIQPNRVRRDQAKRVVEFTAQDWSVMLTNQPLDDVWTRVLPKVVTTRTVPPHTCTSFSTWLMEKAIPGTSNDLTLRVIIWTVVDGVSTWDLAKDDLVSATGTRIEPFKPFPMRVLDVAMSDLQGQKFMSATLSDAVWHSPLRTDSDWGNGVASYSGSFTVVGVGDTGNQSYYKVATAITPNDKIPTYTIALDTVEGIVPGDKLELIQNVTSASWTVMNVDAERKEIITKEKVATALVVGDRLFFSEGSLAEVVFEDARTVLTKACSPYGCDFSRFTPALTPIPVLSWLPLRPHVGGEITSLADVEPGLSNLRVLGSGTDAWDGSPETGWVVQTVTGKQAIWTSQTVTPPSSLMPDETATLNKGARRRNRSYYDFKFRTVDNFETGVDAWNAATSGTAGLVVMHDYLQMRRLKITGTAIVVEPWTGSAWGTTSSATWPSANAVQSACIYPGMPGAVLAYVANDTLEIAFTGSSLASCTVPPDAKGGVLVTTPWAAYLVSTQGYGRVVYSGGTLTLGWVTLSKDVSAFWPNTLCALDQNELIMMGRLEATDRGTGSADRRTDNTSTETWLFRLAAIPIVGSATDSVLWSEKVTDGTPRLVGAFRDPMKAGRAIGQMGGRLFQVARELPLTIERFTPSGMTGGECIEHVCQLHNAVAIPRQDAVMEIVSRSVFDIAIPLVVDQVNIGATRAWDDFYTITRVSTADDLYFYDAAGQEGGKLLEISRHPMVWTNSGAAAMAMCYAAWFGVPREVQDQTWFWTDPTTAPPWEVLPRMARITLNGGTDEWQLMGLQEDLVKGEAKARLVRVFRDGYGLSYGRGRD